MLDLLDSKGIIERVETLREARGWSLYELAKQAAVPVSTLYNWRDKKSLPTLELLDAVCYAFGISVVDFLMGDDGLLALTEEQNELMKLWNSLTCEKKSAIINLMKAMQD